MYDAIIRFLADGTLIIIFICGVGLILWATQPRHWLQKLPVGVMAGLTSLLVGKLMSLVYQPAVARPFLELGASPGAAYIDNPGFPSDHALLAGVVVYAVYFLTPYKKIAGALGLVAVMMGLARIEALVHTPIDVVAGFVAATIGALWYATKKH